MFLTPLLALLVRWQPPEAARVPSTLPVSNHYDGLMVRSLLHPSPGTPPATMPQSLPVQPSLGLDVVHLGFQPAYFHAQTTAPPFQRPPPP